jgi:GNAT superfamily N-acetyltransferase
MPPKISDPEGWVAAGGDAGRLEVLSLAGNVAAFTDGDSRCVAAVHPDRPDTGTIGDWVGGEGVLREAEAWLASVGCTAAEGPALLAPWFPYRANLGPFEQPPMAFEPTERGDRWVAAGYAPVAHYVSVLSAHDPQIRAAMDAAAALSSRGWRLDPIETGPTSHVSPEAYEKAVGVFHAIASAAFADVEGYLGVPADVVAAFYRPFRSMLDPRLALVASDPAGRPAGFVLGVPDHIQPSRKWFELLTMAVRPEHRGAGVATWLVAAVHQAARRAGYVAGVHTVIRVDERQQDRAWFRGEVVRRYALYRRAW